MKTNLYKTAKENLKEVSKQAKRDFTNDLPAIRMIINDEVDTLSKDYNLSEYQRNLLSNYACKLHPKN